jgi:diphthamide biosynthesis protein 3
MLADMQSHFRAIKLETLSAIYTPETTAALSHYREHLRDTRIRLEEKQRIAIQELEAYEAAESGPVDGDDEEVSQEVAGRGSSRNRQAGVGPMIDIARRYGALIKEVESAKMEIRRLNG